MPNLIVGLGVAVPAFAEVAGDTFPSNGYMLENKTYTNAATQKNMGVYDGTVTATAEYDDILYEIMSGTYLPAGSEGDLETCPENSYCPGDVDVTYNETTDQGISSCPSGYPNSAAGASADTQCYTACKVSMVEHATAVDGNDYYNTDADTCSATECENGYHVNETTGIVEKTPLIDVDYNSEGGAIGYAFIGASGEKYAYGDDFYGLTQPGTWAVEFSEGVVYGRSVLTTAINPGLQYFFTNVNSGFESEELREAMTPLVGAPVANYLADVYEDEYMVGLLDATIVALATQKTMPYLTMDANANVYEYCQMTGFAPTGGGRLNIPSAPWVVNYNSSDDVECDICSCAYTLFGGVNFAHGAGRRVYRGAMIGALDFVVGGTCAANEITINWTDATDEDIAANNAGMCTYGGDIRTPVRAATKPGKTFVGWKFDVTE